MTRILILNAKKEKMSERKGEQTRFYEMCLSSSVWGELLHDPISVC